MSNKLVTMNNIRSILMLFIKGYSGRQIAKEIKLSRNTIKVYLERFNASSFSFEQLLEMEETSLGDIAYATVSPSKPEFQKEYFLSRIDYFLSELRRTGVTRNLLWEEYKKDNTNGYSYSQFCDLLARYRKVNEATMHFEHKPAEVMMVDFAGDSLSYVDKSGRRDY